MKFASAGNAHARDIPRIRSDARLKQSQFETVGMKVERVSQ